jgi:hypothetical protein
VAQQLAEQLAEQLAAMTPTWCPADVVGGECPFGEARNCLESARGDGLLVECWQAVLERVGCTSQDRSTHPARAGG